MNKSPSDPITRKYSRQSMDILTSSIPSVLPVLRGQIIGRDDEIRFVSELLQNTDIRLVTLVGFGGAGKTTLSLHIARAIFENFTGGLFFVDLSPITDPALISYYIAQTLKVPEDAQRDRIASINDFISNRAILLILDNFEQVINGAHIIDNLLNSSPNLKVIVTSREPLRLRHEQIVPILPLKQNDALQLFVERARSLNPDFQLTDQNATAIAQLCGRLDRLPLAIELAAMRTTIFSPQSLLDRIQPSLETESPLLGTLNSGARDLPVRQKTLRETINWSYSLLSEAEQLAFRGASLFVGGFDLQALQSVLDQPESQVLEIVSSLVDKNLLQVTGQTKSAQPRFQMYESLREFAGEQIIVHNQHEKLYEKFAAWMLIFSAQAHDGLQSKDQALWLRRMVIESDNLLRILDDAFAATPGSVLWKSGFEILGHTQIYWMISSQFQIAGRWTEKSMSAIAELDDMTDLSPDLKHKYKAIVYGNAGSVAWSKADYLKAIEYHQASHQYYCLREDELGMAESATNSGANYMEIGQHDRALELLELAINLYRNNHHPWGELTVINGLAITYVASKRFDEAHQMYQDGNRLAQQLNQDFLQHVFLCNLGQLEHRLGNTEKASELQRQVLKYLDENDQPYLRTWALSILAACYAEMGKTEEALKLLLMVYPSLQAGFDFEASIYFLQSTAIMCAGSDRKLQAARIMAGLDANIKNKQYYNYNIDEEKRKKLMQSIRFSLQLEQFRQEWDLGQSMEVEGILNFAYQQVVLLDQTQAFLPLAQIFSQREFDVLKLIVRGKSNEEISQELIIVQKTVEKHVASIFRKIKVKNRTEAAAWAIKNHLK